MRMRIWSELGARRTGCSLDSVRTWLGRMGSAKRLCTPFEVCPLRPKAHSGQAADRLGYGLCTCTQSRIVLGLCRGLATEYQAPSKDQSVLYLDLDLVLVSHLDLVERAVRHTGTVGQPDLVLVCLVCLRCRLLYHNWTL